MKQENKYGKVTALKWVVVPDKYFNGFSTSHLFAFHDENIIDNIEANEYEFKADGTRF